MILSCIKRNMVLRVREATAPRYSALVRAHLEYCIQPWVPQFKGNIDKLEHVQKRVTRKVRGREKEYNCQIGLFWGTVKKGHGNNT